MMHLQFYNEAYATLGLNHNSLDSIMVLVFAWLLIS